MATEQVANFREIMERKDMEEKLVNHRGRQIIQTGIQNDTISISSGSFSDLDSEDHAILHETDSESSQAEEYFVVNIPDCFNLSTSQTGEYSFLKSCYKKAKYQNLCAALVYNARDRVSGEVTQLVNCLLNDSR